MRLLAFAAMFVLASFGAVAHGQSSLSWPDRPIRWIVPYPAGGGTDVVARAVADQLTQSLHQSVIVDNRAGGNTIIGTTALAQAAPDGTTIGLITDAFSANVALARPMPYDPDRDFTPIVQLVEVPFVLIANPELVPMRTLPELISYAKNYPGWLTAGSLGPGSPHETALSWFRSMTGIDMLIVPYRGGNLAMTDLLSGQVKVMMSGYPAAEQLIKSGKAYPIAVTSPVRLSNAPDVPTIAEQGYPAYRFASWFGVAAPAKLAPELVSRLNTEINQALEAKDVRERIVTAGGVIVGGPPARLRQTIRESTDRYRRIFGLTGPHEK